MKELIKDWLARGVTLLSFRLRTKRQKQAAAHRRLDRSRDFKEWTPRGK